MKETRPKHVVRLSVEDYYKLFWSMITSRQLWGHILLIAGTNSILFGFYQEAPFVFIENLGMQPKSYGCFGLLIAAATVLAAHISHRQSNHLSASTLIRRGVICVMTGAVAFTFIALLGVFSLKIGMGIAILALFIIFFGIGLIIPNSLSCALKAYQTTAGTAGSIFGG